ncbi:UTP--glucose-1-phosphate uridylyltransferase [Candidatus Saccharibacteria bacterium]|nr:MAG: UTP--glucose-1-phosphate uridylyltransferase [Candidatus Saccharibacteria bacterium]
MAQPKKVTKAVIAAAGFGTRFLPQTKAMPKEMLPLIDKPIIQYAVEDLVSAGIKDIIIVGSSSKRAIEDHFDVPNEDLLVNIRAGGPKKAHFITEMEDLANMANFIYIRQKGPYGNATPIANAAHLIGNEPFIFVYADDLVVSEPNTFTQMIELYNELGGSIATCMRVSTDKEFERYGILAGEEKRDGVLEMSAMVEKPGRAAAPSNYAHVSSYLFDPAVLNYIDSGLANLPKGEEFYVATSLVDPMLKDGHKFFGCLMQNSRRYDTGDKLEYLMTVVAFGLRHKDLGPAFRAHLEELLKES